MQARPDTSIQRNLLCFEARNSVQSVSLATLLVVVARARIFVVATLVRRAVSASVVTTTRLRDDRND